MSPDRALPLAACGDDCNACPRYIATQSGDLEQIKTVASLWHRAGLRPQLPSPQEMICHGCLTSRRCPWGIQQ